MTEDVAFYAQNTVGPQHQAAPSVGVQISSECQKQEHSSILFRRCNQE